MGHKKWQALRHQHAPGLRLPEVDGSANARRGMLHRMRILDGILYKDAVESDNLPPSHAGLLPSLVCIHWQHRLGDIRERGLFAAFP